MKLITGLALICFTATDQLHPQELQLLQVALMDLLLSDPLIDSYLEFCVAKVAVDTRTHFEDVRSK